MLNSCTTCWPMQQPSTSPLSMGKRRPSSVSYSLSSRSPEEIPFSGSPSSPPFIPRRSSPEHPGIPFETLTKTFSSPPWFPCRGGPNPNKFHDCRQFSSFPGSDLVASGDHAAFIVHLPCPAITGGGRERERELRRRLTMRSRAYPETEMAHPSSSSSSLGSPLPSCGGH